MEKEMEKEKNIMMANYYLKVNFLMGKYGLEKEENMILEVNYYLKVNI